MFRDLCGEKTLKNVVLVTNKWDMVPPEVSEAHEDELSSSSFKPALEKGARMVRYHNTTQSTHDVLRVIMGKPPVALQMEQELVDEHRDIINKAIGGAINQKLNEQAKQHQDELKRLQEGMVQALKEKDEETRMELEEERERLQELVENAKKASEGMAANYAAEKERVEARAMEVEREAMEERERAKAELAELPRRLQDETSASAAYRARLEGEIKELQDRVTTAVTVPPCVRVLSLTTHDD